MYAALVRNGWSLKKQVGSHRKLGRAGSLNFTFVFHQIGPAALAQTGKDSVITILPSQNRGNPTKTKPRIVPIYGKMRACLEMAQAERDRDCPNRKWVVQYGGARVNDIKKAFHAACERVGIEGSVLIHDLRRTALTDMEEAGVPRHSYDHERPPDRERLPQVPHRRERSVIQAGRTMEQ